MSTEKATLTRLKLHKYRHVKPGTELTFNDRFNVLLGKNGTGKTTLLDLISMVLRSDFSALRGQAFHVEYDFRYEHGEGSVCFKNELISSPAEPTAPQPQQQHKREGLRHQSSVRLRLHHERSSSPEDGDYEVKIISGAAQSRRLGEAWSEPEIVDVFEGSLLRTFAGALSDADPTSRVRASLYAFASGGSWVYRFDESLGIFDSITGDASAGADDRRLVPPISLDVSFGTTGQWSRSQFVPDFYKATEPAKDQSTTIVEPPHNASLAGFPLLIGVARMSMSMSIVRSWNEPPRLWWELGPAHFVFSLENAASFNHTALSYGQKRLLSFLYYRDANPRFIVADELINGMHHEWIHGCLDRIDRHQVFLTSQNPLLLDFLPLESADEFKRSFIQCRVETGSDARHMAWSNLVEDEAEELFQDYKAGIQPIGELLRVRGLW